MSRTMIIDTDTASDDAVALIMALRHPDVTVAGITTVAGNCNVDQATRNAIYTVELCGRDIPVHRGSDRPLVEQAEYATWFHGEDGLGDQGYPPPVASARDEDGVTALVRLIHENPGCLLVTLGPLTNVAKALERSPDIVGQVDRCVVMGGAANAVGNVTPAAEFNLWFDPHAAARVFESGLPLELAPWEICRGAAGFLADERDRIRAMDTPLAHFLLDANAVALAAILEQSGSTTLELPDPAAMAVALAPQQIVTRQSRHHVAIEDSGRLTRGMSVVDSLDVTGLEPTAEVVWEIDAEAFKAMVVDSIS